MNQQPAEASVVFVDEETCKEPYISWPFVLNLLSRKKGLWILIVVLCTIGACLFKGFTDPQISGALNDQYQTTALIYVSPLISPQTGESVYFYDTSSSTLIKNVILTLQQENTMETIAHELGFPSGDDMMKHLEITNPSSSSIIQLTAITDSSDTSYQMVNRTLEAFDGMKDSLFPQANIITVLEPSAAAEPMKIGAGAVAKSMLKFAVLGFAGGLLIDIIIIACKTIGNSHFRDAREVDYLYGVTPAATGSSPEDPKAMEMLRASLLLHPEEKVILISGQNGSDKTADALHKALENSHFRTTLATSHELMKDAPEFDSLSSFLCSPDCSRALEKLAEKADFVLFSVSCHDDLSSLIPAALNADRTIFCISSAKDERSDVTTAWNALQQTGTDASIYLVLE